MAIYLPRNLVTTMGTELTFMPAIHERIFQSTKGKVNSAKTYQEDGLRYFLASVLEKVLQENKIECNKCSLDPDCVEVSTQPYKTANGLMKAIRAIRRHAQDVDLTPISSYTIGGGAHIHTGVLGDSAAQREIYKSQFMVWAINNPWIAWAFAGLNDDSNANPLKYEAWETRERKTSIEYLINCYEGQKSEYEDELNSLTHYVQQAHAPNTAKRDRRDYMEYANGRRKWMMKHKMNMHRIAGEILAYYMTPDPVDDSRVKYDRISRQRGKGHFIRHTDYGRHGTVEFRCFLMQPTAKAHEKHIMLVNAICRYVWEQTQACEDGMINKPEQRKLSMKYSEAKRGFNTMLDDIGLNPADFRRECVNIALRMRYRRPANRKNGR